MWTNRKGFDMGNDTGPQTRIELWTRWFNRYGADYGHDADAAKADFERYLAERESMRVVFSS